MTYSFDGVELPLVQSPIIPQSARIASGETPAHAGSYTGIRRPAARTATLVGTLKSTSFAALNDDWATLLAAHDVDTPRALVVEDGWFYYATPESLTESEVEVTNLRYQADYRIGDPYAYSLNLSNTALATSGATTFTAGGKVAALPTITLNISAAVAGGYVTITNSTTVQTTTILAETAGQFRFNSRTETVEIGAPRLLSGAWLTLAKGANTITVTPSAGVTLSSASIEWRARSL